MKNKHSILFDYFSKRKEKKQTNNQTKQQTKYIDIYWVRFDRIGYVSVNDLGTFVSIFNQTRYAMLKISIKYSGYVLTNVYRMFLKHQNNKYMLNLCKKNTLGTF